MKKLHFILVPIALAALITMPAVAADKPNMAGMKMDAPEAITGQVHKAKGVVNSVDIKDAKVNLSHEAIPSLNWPKMTMSFKVSDKQGLAMLKPGQYANFELSEKAPGQYIITKITPVK
ncbi:MAG: copper-binding protein [Sulfuriferula sp.]